MSKMCGDTARFHRIQNRRLAMRARMRELRAAIEVAPNSVRGRTEDVRASPLEATKHNHGDVHEGPKVIVTL